MSDINNERLFHFANPKGCWHKTTNEYPFRCAICGQSETDWQGWFICPHNPDYSTSPADRERLLLYLMGQEEMWKAFKTAILTAKIGEPYDGGIIVYLFSFIDGAPRWVSLLSEWLGMESTREKWGWEECPTCWKPGDYTGSLPMFCPKCNSSGRVRAEWAREVREGK